MSAVAVAAAARYPRILCVDDEPQVLDAITLNLRRQYEVLRATGGAEALEILAREPDIVAVISDMRMPQMDGATFLAAACKAVPDVVRILLTGQADLAAAIAAVNNGQIFRFLTKPCPVEVLRTTLASAYDQHRLVTSERVLLEQTLRGSIQALVDILALTNPAAFGRANRIKTTTKAIAKSLALRETWQLECAALLSQLGQVVLPDELCAKLQQGHALTDDESKMVARVPAITEQLLAHIPRLEAVREILALHGRPPHRASVDPKRQLVELGAHILRLALDLDALEVAATPEPLRVLAGRELYDREVVAALEHARGAGKPRTVREVAVSALRVGMVFADDVHMLSGALLVARGYEITPGFLERIGNYPPGAVPGPVRILS